MGKKKVSQGEIKKKKITFASAILFVIGSSIGAGIFLKNSEVLGNVGNSIVLALISWVLSILGVVCMGLSLVEISSASTNSDLGIVAWVKSFNHKYLYKVSKYFMAYLYLPINFFIMPYYLVMTMQEAIGWQTTWWISALIALAITTWLFFMSGLSSRAADVTNKAVTSVKFIPLAFCAIVGIVLACCGQIHVGQEGYPQWLPQPGQWGIQEGHHLLTTLLPVMGIFGSIPAIIFSFDGFYAATGIQSQMEEPKRTPMALIIGLVIVSALDVLISISLLIGSKDGSVGSINWFNDNGLWHVVISVMQILIAIGILGIINGFAVYNPLYYEELIKNYELPFSNKLHSKLDPNKHWVGLIYSGILTAIFFVVLTIIGAYGYMDVTGYHSTELIPFFGLKDGQLPLIGYQADSLNAGGSIHALYSMADLMANWTAIIAFLCIVFALIGAYKNRKTKKVKVVPVKGFKGCTIVSSIIISIAIAFIVVSTFANIGIVATWHADIGKVIEGETYTGDQWFTDMLGVIMTLVILILFILVCCIPSSIEMKKEKNRPLNWQTWR